MRTFLVVFAGLGVAAVLFLAIALLIIRRDLARFLKDAAAGRFTVVRAEWRRDGPMRSLDIAGSTRDGRFLLTALADRSVGRVRYALKLDGPWTFRRTCRSDDIGHPFARAHRLLMRRALSRRAALPDPPRKDVA